MKNIIAGLVFMIFISAGIFAGCEFPTNSNQTKTESTDSDQKVNSVVEIVDSESAEESETANSMNDLDFYEKPITLGDSFWDLYEQSILKNYRVYIGSDANNEEIQLPDELIVGYEVGDILKAPYEGWKLLIVEVRCEGPCFQMDYYRFAYNPETRELVFFPHYSQIVLETGLIDEMLETKDIAVEFSDLESKDEIPFPDSDEVAIMVNKIYDLWVDFDRNDQNVAFVDETVGEVYQNDSTGYLEVWNDDGTISAYSFYSGMFTGPTDYIVWDDDRPDENIPDNYSPVHRGCGAILDSYYLEKVKPGELEKIATTSGGIDLYVVSDPEYLGEEPYEDPTFDTTANGSLNRYFASIKFQYEDMTFEEYVDNDYLLFWQDPLGRYSAIVNNDVKILAECGKPVIYLYPENPMNLKVSVDIDEFTVTVPEHGENGWNVIAYPDGSLLNLADNAVYPYLFWEGHDEDNAKIDSGFSIAKADLENFLNESLSKLGLNEIEKADFMEFWLPIMLDNPEPYVFVSFIGTEEFNKIAPLNISPEPDTLIRVFMYYQPLFAPLDLPEQFLSSKPRIGFTVIEWGGTSSKPWN
ncbi:hypothetical protein GF376_02255 [Candidatus Peregrinibacteria bacterium]|nr:hypothetical protein [Candidatus Peregrinibacteria bacterium]